MAKRFTDSNKFRNSWYRKLSPKQKCIWEYLLAECNHAGIIEIDFDDMTYHIGATVTQNDLQIFEGRIHRVEDSKYKIIIPDFISFQYGDLNAEIRVHKSILDILKKYGIKDIKQEFLNPCPTLNLPLTNSTLTLKQGLDSPKEKPKKNNSRQDKYSEEFEKFWAIWIAHPNHRQTDNKSNAWEAWNKHSDRPALSIITPIALAYLGTKDAKEGCAQMLSTWLNQKGWTMAVRSVDQHSKPCPIKGCSSPVTHVFGKFPCCEKHFYKLDDHLRELKKKDPDSGFKLYEILEGTGLELKESKTESRGNEQ